MQKNDPSQLPVHRQGDLIPIHITIEPLEDIPGVERKKYPQAPRYPW